MMISEAQAGAQNDMPEVFVLPSYNGHNLYEISVDELQHLFTSGSLSSAGYVQFCLDRIQRVSDTLIP